MQCKAKGKGEKIHTEKAEHRALLRKFNFHMEIWSCIEGRAGRQGAAAVAVKKEGIGRDNCNLLSKEYIAVNFSSTKGSQHLFSFIHKCVAHSFS